MKLSRMIKQMQKRMEEIGDVDVQEALLDMPEAEYMSEQFDIFSIETDKKWNAQIEFRKRKCIIDLISNNFTNETKRYSHSQ